MTNAYTCKKYAMRAIELFSGAGGLCLGLKSAGFKPKLVLEFNHDACHTIRHNQHHFGFKSSSFLYEGDIRNFDFNDPNLRDIDLLAGGPPCQPFSVGGKATGYLDSRDMFPELIRAIRETLPKSIIVENVRGLTRQKFKNYFNYILLQIEFPFEKITEKETWNEHYHRLEKLHTKGYSGNVTYNLVHRVLNSADYGVPQKRERVFIVGFRSDLGISWTFPETTHSKSSLEYEQIITRSYWEKYNLKSIHTDLQKKNIEHDGKLPWLTIRDAISDLGSPLASEFRQYNTNHILQTGAKVYKGHNGSYIDSPSKTLKAGDHGVPGGENMIRFEDGSVRYLTIREAARLQTFPDTVFFPSSWTESMRQIGNAVPVKLAGIIAKSVFHSLAKQKP